MLRVCANRALREIFGLTEGGREGENKWRMKKFA
jgi:hypothetical protein